MGYPKLEYLGCFSYLCSVKSEKITYTYIREEFKCLLEVSDWTPPLSYEEAFNDVLSHARIKVTSRRELAIIIADACANKLNVYYSTVHNIIDECAKKKIYFNYNEKLFLSQEIKNKETIKSFLETKQIDREQAKILTSYSIEDIYDLRNRIKSLMSEDTKWKDVLDSIFAEILFNIFEKKDIEKYNSHIANYDKNYFKFLRLAYPAKFERNNALSILHITSELYSRYNTYNDFVGFLFSFIRQAYNTLNNYSYLAIHIEDLGLTGNESIQWRLFSDIILFAEKHREERLHIGYFHPQKIKNITKAYIHELEDVDFEIAYGGFTYKDCYIINNDNYDSLENTSKYSMLLLFQKNHRDEDIIPCPACRSINVRGNSYPTIGVKSWECKNPLCPDKSKYNRGKRYSFASILKQESISSDENEIEKELINKWRLDVVSTKSLEDILEMLILEYSFVGDVVKLYNIDVNDVKKYKRRLIKEEIPNIKENPCTFWENGYFKRFLVTTGKINVFRSISYRDGINIYQGNCFDVLNSMPADSIYGAVTSPPYYNAKEYSSWDNIYCYLYDMYNHARAVFRTLTPGAYFLYNIFDYFDNEKNLVFSDMGKKRLILGAYIIYMFRKIGFEIADNTIWHKGHIQGNRSNNQGNNSPYYQAPLNCYEHIFIFRKPSENVEHLHFPKLLNVSPVIKIVKGKNILGHTAPFPIAIPNMLLKRVNQGPILDPYAGSFTTARATRQYGYNSISIELSTNYCELGIKLIESEIENANKKPSLFDDIDS